MKTVEKHDFRMPMQHVALKDLWVCDATRRSLKFLSEIFLPSGELNRLNPRLRRDGGIDELELERANAARDLLIR